MGEINLIYFDQVLFWFCNCLSRIPICIGLRLSNLNYINEISHCIYLSVLYSYQVVLCECLPGWTGDFCEDNFDACADNPCFLGITCIDEDPPSMKSSCGSCPQGLTGDGKACEGM